MNDVRLTKDEFHQLADYNGRRGRGHIPTYEEWWEMAILQWRWNVDQREQYLDADFTPLPAGGGYIRVGPRPHDTFIPYVDWSPSDFR